MTSGRFIDESMPYVRAARRSRRAPRLYAIAAGLLVSLGLAVRPADAASYFFSNCAVGGAGTQSNPWCLDPAGSGAKTSFRNLMDGASPEVAAGDTIYLCAGACDGSGSATYNLGVSGTTSNGYSYTFGPIVSGTASSPITITSWPGENVVLSGDTNGNGVPDTNEPQVLVTNMNQGGRDKSWYVWKNLTFERVRENMFYINANPANWTFDNIEVRYTNDLMWNGGNIYDVGCNNETGGFVFKLADLAAPLTIKNSRFHHICGAVHRYTVNKVTGAQVLHLNNEYYNISTVDNEFQGRNVTWRGNYLHDFYDGISMEEDMQGIVIEDNIVACPGDYKVSFDGRCGTGITINDGNNGASAGGRTKDIIIRRNKVYGSIDGVYAGSGLGYFFCAVTIIATNDTEPINILVENNMIWHHRSWSEDYICAAGIGIKTNRSEVTVQNNTVYDSSYGIVLDAYVPGIAYTVRNNLLIRANKGNSNRQEMLVFANAVNSVIRNNNLHSDGQGDPVLTVNGTNYNCSQMASFQTGNKCAATTFVRTTGTVKDWDLHLPSTDTANRNAGMAGPADDIDKAPRGAAPIDLGADEYGGSGSLSATLALQSGGQPAPQVSGAWALKAGTYGVSMTTSSPVIVVPTPLTFTAAGGGTTLVTLAGAVPGTTFTGSFTVGSGTAEGNGAFTLPANVLDDGQGNRGSTIVVGAAAIIDRTPPASPTGVRTQ